MIKEEFIRYYEVIEEITQNQYNRLKFINNKD